jgi:hypothetical protein
MRYRLDQAQDVPGAMIDLAHQKLHVLFVPFALAHIRDEPDDMRGTAGAVAQELNALKSRDNRYRRAPCARIGGNPDGVFLKALGERFDRFWHRRREQERAASGGAALRMNSRSSRKPKSSISSASSSTKARCRGNPA